MAVRVAAFYKELYVFLWRLFFSNPMVAMALCEVTARLVTVGARGSRLDAGSSAGAVGQAARA